MKGWGISAERGNIGITAPVACGTRAGTWAPSFVMEYETPAPRPFNGALKNAEH
jgi:hypothetical protein